MRHLRCKSMAVLAITTALAAPGYGATVSSTFNYSGSQGLFGPGAVGFDESSSVDLGIARLGFGAKASSGQVNATGEAKLTTTYEDEVELNTATAVSVALSSVRGAFSTLLGAAAEISLDVYRINAGPINFNPPKVSAGPDYSLATSGTATRLNRAASGADAKRLTGVGVPTPPVGLKLTGEANLNASQKSSFILDDVFGIVEARNTATGDILTDAFSLGGDATGDFTFGTAGLWDLSLKGVGLKNRFDADFGLTASYTIGIGVGAFCGDPTDSGDNFGCIYEAGRNGTTPQLTLLNGTPFGINWGLQSASLGSISVIDSSISAVPLPATLPLMLAGFGGMLALRRRKTA